MQIEKIRIRNLRAFKDEEVHLSDYTALVGPNGAGKSTVLCALNIFFRDNENSSTNIIELDREDFHNRDTTNPIEITITFKDLSEQAKEAFAEYYRHDRLVVSAKAEFDEISEKAPVKQYGQRLVMPHFQEFFRLYNDGAKAPELTVQFQKIRAVFDDVPDIKTKDGMKSALRDYESAHPELCSLIPSEDQFYGFSKGANRLGKFIQWIYIPALKDTLKENTDSKNTVLGKLLSRTVRTKVSFTEQINLLKEKTLEEYRAIIGEHQAVLSELSNLLSERLTQWAHPEARARLEWSDDPNKSIHVEEPIARAFAGEGPFEGELARFGHGLQRSYLLALLQELSKSDDDSAPRLLLGCEEPELYQHPPQARHLASVLIGLSEANAQVVVSTHSPHFVSGQYFESVRMVRQNAHGKCSAVGHITFENLSKILAEVKGEAITPIPAQRARLQQALQPHLSEMFFTKYLVLVEGIEDIAYLTSWMVLRGLWDDFRKHGCHFVHANGKGYMIEPLLIAQSLGIPTFVLFDADGNKTNPNERSKHEKDNLALIRLLKGDETSPFPSNVVWSGNHVIWPSNFGDTIKSEVTPQIWDQTFGQATKELGSPQGSYTKNPVHIGEHLELLAKQGIIPASLDRLCREIIAFSSGTADLNVNSGTANSEQTAAIA